MPLYRFFLGEASAAKIDYSRKGTLIRTSLLEDLVIEPVFTPVRFHVKIGGRVIFTGQQQVSNGALRNHKAMREVAIRSETRSPKADRHESTF